MIELYKHTIESVDTSLTLADIKQVMDRVNMPIHSLAYAITEDRYNVKKMVISAVTKLRLTADKPRKHAYINTLTDQRISPDHDPAGWDAACRGFITQEKKYPPQFTDSRCAPTTIPGMATTCYPVYGSSDYQEMKRLEKEGVSLRSRTVTTSQIPTSLRNPRPRESSHQRSVQPITRTAEPRKASPGAGSGGVPPSQHQSPSEEYYNKPEDHPDYADWVDEGFTYSDL